MTKDETKFKLSIRLTVSCNMVSSPVKVKNCLGYAALDAGHKREPEPPEIIIGLSIFYLLENLKNCLKTKKSSMLNVKC